jgi:hypothetical protein
MPEDEAVMPLVAVWIFRKPGAAVPRQALAQLVAAAAGQLQGAGVARVDLQPQPRHAAAPVRPAGQGFHAAQADAASPLLGAYPVGELGAVRAVGHEPQGSDQPLTLQDAIGGLLPAGRVLMPDRMGCAARSP